MRVDFWGGWRRPKNLMCIFFAAGAAKKESVFGLLAQQK